MMRARVEKNKTRSIDFQSQFKAQKKKGSQKIGSLLACHLGKSQPSDLQTVRLSLGPRNSPIINGYNVSLRETDLGLKRSYLRFKQNYQQRCSGVPDLWQSPEAPAFSALLTVLWTLSSGLLQAYTEPTLLAPTSKFSFKTELSVVASPQKTIHLCSNALIQFLPF